MSGAAGGGAARRTPVGRAGRQVVEEVRRQFREKPGIMAGTQKPEYGKKVAILTAAAQKALIRPLLIPVAVPVVVLRAQGRAAAGAAVAALGRELP